MPKTIAEISYEAQALIQFFLGRLKEKPNEVVAYQDASEACGRDVRTAAHGAMATARKRLHRDHGIVLEVVRSVGFVWVKQEALVESRASGVAAIRRRAKREADKLAHGGIQWDTLDNGAKVKANALLSLYGMVGSVATAPNMKKIEGKVSAAQGGQLALGHTLRLFSGNGGDDGKP